MIPTIPQQDTPAERAARRAALAQAQTEYVYDHDTQIRPLGAAASVPEGQGFSPILIGAGATVVLGLVDNLLSEAAKLFTRAGAWAGKTALQATEKAAVEAVFKELTELRASLVDSAEEVAFGRATSRVLPEAPSRILASALHTGVSLLERGLEAVDAKVMDRVTGGHSQGQRSPLDWLESLVKLLARDAARALATEIGVYGPASALQDYAAQFSVLVPPSFSAAWEEDQAFAWLRLAGPNPMVIQGVSALPPALPLSEADYQSVMGPDTLQAALQEGRIFLADYAVLASVPLGTFPDGQKYLAAPLALFATPPAGAADRRLRPVAIRLKQTDGRDNPVFLADGSPGWRLAKLYVSVADGNYHETISHLGLTHLVLEAFAMATPRQLAAQHPLRVLLDPHLQGTLAINNAALGSLIAPGGTVDRLLSGTIEGSTALAVNAVLDLDFGRYAFPANVEGRKVDSREALPDFPWRDDGALLWEDVESWVREYLAIYYPTDDLISGDPELQGWVAELQSPAGGGVKGIGEGGVVATFPALVRLVTQTIFMASVQHAAVNFPQRTVMSFTPALPLAAYAPPPTSTDVPDGDGPVLAALPPLQDAEVQLLVGSLLGGVYFTRLGDYDRFQGTPTFQDPRVATPLANLQRRLRETEQMIGARNLSRPSYETLLPSAIPQSINI